MDNDGLVIGRPEARGLQSLRGIAAILVLLHHSLRTVSGADAAEFVGSTVINPHAAVVLFFVLSGFVLTLSLARSGVAPAEIGRFYLRRMFRIFPALWAGVGLGAIYLAVSLYLPKDHFAVWVTALYRHDLLSASTVVESLLGVSSYLLPVLWTIKVELAASLFMPFIFYLLSNRQGVIQLLILLVFVAVSFAGKKAVSIYLVQFVLGAFVAINFRHIVAGWFRPWQILPAVACLLYFRQLHDWDYHAALPSLVEGCAAAVIIVGVGSGRLRWLQTGPLVALGDWSYGIYLLHMPVAFLLTFAAASPLTQGLDPDIAAIGITAATLSITIALAALLHRWVERPTMDAGRRLSATGLRTA